MLRRKIMTGITGNLGSSERHVNYDPIIQSEIKKVLIVRPNHRLGNQLLLSPLIQEIQSAFPNSKVDLFVKGGLAPIIFRNYTGLDKIIALPKKHFKELYKYTKGWFYINRQNYDLVINVEKGSSSGNLATHLSSARYKMFGEETEQYKIKDNYEHAAKKPVYNFRDFILERGIKSEQSAVPTLDLKLDEAEIAKGKDILNSLVPEGQGTICIFTHATGTKNYPEEWWKSFHRDLKAGLKGYNILEILPIENISKLDFSEPSFYSKDIREMGAVMANTDIFIGADSGIMHLASSVKIPTLGLFSVTNSDKYQPYGNQSRAVNTDEIESGDLVKIIKSILMREIVDVEVQEF